MASALKAYNRFLHKYPTLAMSLTTGTTMGLGNIISQKVIEKKENIDWGRITRFAAYGYIFSGPFLRFWYFGLDKYFAAAKLKPVKMMIVDQMIGAPLLNGALVAYLPWSNGKSWQETKATVRKDLPSILKANYAVWPAIQLTNFYFIPVQHRVLFVNLVSLFWSTFLGFKTQPK